MLALQMGKCLQANNTHLSRRARLCSLQLCVLKSQPLRRWLNPKGGALSNGISVLMKETAESSLLPITWGCNEKLVIYEPGWVLTRRQTHLDLGLPELWEINVCHFSYSAQGIFAIAFLTKAMFTLLEIIKRRTNVSKAIWRKDKCESKWKEENKIENSWENHKACYSRSKMRRPKSPM
jgi:hypothetical protein